MDKLITLIVNETKSYELNYLAIKIEKLQTIFDLLKYLPPIHLEINNYSTYKMLRRYAFELRQFNQKTIHFTNNHQIPMPTTKIDIFVTTPPLLRWILFKKNIKNSLWNGMISLMQQQNVQGCIAPPLASPNRTTPPPRFKYILLYIQRGVRSSTSSEDLATCSCVRRAASWKRWQGGDLVKMALLTHPAHPPPTTPNSYYLNGSSSHMKLCYRVHMLDIETTHILASVLEAKFSLKNMTEIPRPVHGPLQFQEAGSACHPTKANTIKAYKTKSAKAKHMVAKAKG